MPLLEYRNNPEFDTIAYRIKPGDNATIKDQFQRTIIHKAPYLFYKEID